MSLIYFMWKLMRPGQWVKNSFIFVPIFFAGDLFNYDKIFLLLSGFISFCFVSSSVYILNDMMDVEADKLHPVKMLRPLASGQVSRKPAIVQMVLLSFFGLILSYSVDVMLFLILLLYAFINIGYSLGLKNFSIVDILIVATGFVLRTIAGGLVADVDISHWLIIMVFLLSLFLVLAKRREDMKEFISSGTIMRKSIANYSMDFINLTLTMLSGVIIVAYIMYTLSPDVNAHFHSENLYITSVFVIIGILRYLQITLVENKGGSPVKIFYSDTFIQITLVLWILSFFLIIYLK